MHEPETCPRCSARFEARKALVSSGVAFGFNVFTLSDVTVPVRCPGCGHVFPTRTLRLFGFLPPNGVRWVLLAVVVAALAIVSW